MSQDGRQFVLILPSCADGSIFGITVRSGATGKAATLWDVKSGPSLPADHRLVLGDATDFTVVTPWTVPKPGQAMEVDVVLGNYDQTYHGDFRTDAIGAAINGGIAHNHRDVTQKQLDADAHCS